MGVILDTSVLIASERRPESIKGLLGRLRTRHGDLEAAMSVVSVVELTHGLYRAKTDSDFQARDEFLGDVLNNLVVHPVDLAIGRLAGRIEGEQAAVGNLIAFPDLLIGATALHLGWEIVTLNAKHFRRIPGLNVISV